MKVACITPNAVTGERKVSQFPLIFVPSCEPEGLRLVRAEWNEVRNIAGLKFEVGNQNRYPKTGSCGGAGKDRSTGSCRGIGK